MSLERKSTMIKDRIGICKTSCRNLPPPDHVYGYKAKTDAEGAGALISTWVTANPSEHEGREEIIVYSNVLAIKHGCITARDMRQCTSTPGGCWNLCLSSARPLISSPFDPHACTDSKDHPCIRMKEILTEAAPTAQFEGPFGIKTKFAEEPLTDIIQGKYTNFATDDQDYPNVSVIAKLGLMPKPKPTIASESIAMAREKQRVKETMTKKKFVMKKFQNIKGVALQEIAKVPGKN